MRKGDTGLRLLADPVAPMRSSLEIVKLAGDNPVLRNQASDILQRQMSHPHRAGLQLSSLRRGPHRSKQVLTGRRSPSRAASATGVPVGAPTGRMAPVGGDDPYAGVQTAAWMSALQHVDLESLAPHAWPFAFCQGPVNWNPAFGPNRRGSVIGHEQTI